MKLFEKLQDRVKKHPLIYGSIAALMLSGQPALAQESVLTAPIPKEDQENIEPYRDISGEAESGQEFVSDEEYQHSLTPVINEFQHEINSPKHDESGRLIAFGGFEVGNGKGTIPVLRLPSVFSYETDGGSVITSCRTVSMRMVGDKAQVRFKCFNQIGNQIGLVSAIITPNGVIQEYNFNII